jgi:hypothetical protein
MLKVPHEVGAHMGGCYRPQKFKDLIENIRSFFYIYTMKHLHKFEAFIIPKAIRKHHPWWGDEDIALQVLQELKSIKKSGQDIDAIKTDKGWKFKLDGYDFEVEYYEVVLPSGLSMNGNLNLNGERIQTSDEVCKQIFNLVNDMQVEESPVEQSKKSFRIRKGLI